MTEKYKKKDIVYLEVLRIAAIIGVLFNHTNKSGFFLFAETANKAEYVISLVFSVLCKMSVPLFFMISGFLLLGKKESFAEVIKKRVVRYGLVIVLSVLFTYTLTALYQKENFSVRELVKAIYRGDIGTYWFLYAYLGLMLMLPFLRGITSVLSKTTVYYLLLLRILCRGLLPAVMFVLLGYDMSPALYILLLEDSLFYFLTGYYFGTADNPLSVGWVRAACWCASGVSVALSCFMTYYEHKVTGNYTENFLENFLPVVCITLFCTMRYSFGHIKISDRLKKVILFLGDKTLGIYLLEPVFRLYFSGFRTQLTDNFPPLTASILWCILIFGAGVLAVWLLKCIPAVRKLI